MNATTCSAGSSVSDSTRAMKSSSCATSPCGVALHDRTGEVVLGRKVMEEGALARPGVGDHGVDRRRGEPLVEDQSLGAVEDSLRVRVPSLAYG